MRKGGGKQKGASFEREVCKSLSLWVSGGKQEDAFWRSAMSGGRSTVAAAKGKKLTAQAGDITCIHPVGQRFADRFLIECKHYANLDYIGLLASRGKLLGFWLKLRKDADHYNKHPFMVVRQNRTPTMVCLDTGGQTILALSPLAFTLAAPQHNLLMMDADTFFNICHPLR
jgi:hypothetical protein